jgi:ABC-type phosphate transport system substrate-binding protein
MRTRRSHGRRSWMPAALLAIGVLLVVGPLPKAAAVDYQAISGEGSSWAANAIDSMATNVRPSGIAVNYARTGSTAGRNAYLNGTVDFAASDIPFQTKSDAGSAPENPRDPYAYIPITAGGTAFMYNLKIAGKRVTNLRLSGENVTKIFTGVITMWNDPAIQADNPGLVMPARAMVPVVRSDGSGSSAQLTKWMINQYPALWTDYCSRAGRAPECDFTSFYPTTSGMISQNGDDGIASYVVGSSNEGSIGYVNYSYALNDEFPVVKLLNKAGFYTEPTPENVAVSLLQAKINNDASNLATYLTQQLDGVYNDTDPRNYQLSSYSYLIVPAGPEPVGQFNLVKGATLGDFAFYAMCEAQQASASLGYSPMPVNLVEASFDQIRKIPGAVVPNIDITQCHNPTFSPDGRNLLAENAPQPKGCDKQSAFQCPDGTAGAANTPTAISAGAVFVVVVGGGSGSGAAGNPGAPAVPGAAADPGAPADPAAPGAVAGPVGGSTSAAKPAPGAGPAAGAPGAATGASPTAAAAGSAAGQVCDADTGVCPSAAAGPTSNGAPAGGATPAAAAAQALPGAAAASTLSDSSGWNTSLALMMLVIGLTLALVLAPALTWRHLSKAAT